LDAELSMAVVNSIYYAVPVLILVAFFSTKVVGKVLEESSFDYYRYNCAIAKQQVKGVCLLCGLMYIRAQRNND
jgi:hypothetical protein